jgi:hypothetical protein
MVKPAVLYEYYGRQDIAPTFADLRDEAAVADYQSAREALLVGRLALPIPFFRGAEVLEYGPDTGENAMVFARWGARMTLVEPALAAHSKVGSYFERFAPAGALRELVVADVLTYVCERRFDMVVAEGFVYTISPKTAWLDAFRRALVPGGLVLVSYYERTASLFELMLRVPFAALRRRDGCDRLAAAERLYRPKWDRIPHTRSFDSWVLDVLENPFVRLHYFIDASELVVDAAASGFGLHSSWPSYRDGLENAWGKRPTTKQETLARTRAHLRRSVLTFVLGTKAYLVNDAESDRLTALVERALTYSDALIDADDPARSRSLAATLRELAAATREASTIVDSSAALLEGAMLLDAWADVNTLLADGAIDAAATRLREDTVLLDGWGTPSHLAVLRAEPVTAASGAIP